MCIFNLDMKDLTLDFIKNNTNNEKEINNYILLNKNSKYLELPKEKYTKKTNIIQKIINHFGYSMDNMNITLDRENFVEKLNTIKNIYNSDEFINLFGNYKENINNSLKAHIGYLNGLLHNWKLCVISVQKNYRSKGKKGTIAIYYYKLMNYNK